MGKQNKTSRWHMRVHKELDERAVEVARQTGKSLSKFVQDLIWKVVLSPEKYFATCPTCGVAMFDPEEIPMLDGIIKAECINGHKHWYDFEEEKWVR